MAGLQHTGSYTTGSGNPPTPVDLAVKMERALRGGCRIPGVLIHHSIAGSRNQSIGWQSVIRGVGDNCLRASPRWGIYSAWNEAVGNDLLAHSIRIPQVVCRN